MAPGRSRWAVAAAAAATVLFAAAVELRPGGAAVTRWIDDCGTIAAAAAATILCARTAVRLPQVRRFWWLLVAALSCWTLGELGWAAYDLPHGDVPQASWADVAYLAALPPLAAALLSHPSFHGRRLGRARSLVDGLAVTAAVFLVAWLALLEPLRRDHDVLSTAGLVTLAYPLSDVVILVLVVLVVRGTTTSDRRDLWWLLAGLLLMALSDSVYAYLSEVHSFATGNIVDTGWIAAYLAIGLGALRARPVAVTVRERPAELTTAAVLTPLAIVLGSLMALTVRLQAGPRLGGVGIATALALIGLVLVRQVLLVLDVVNAGERGTTFATRVRAALGDAR